MRSLRRISFSTKVQIATVVVAGTALAVVATCPACRGGESFFNQSCVQDWPQPVCALGNVMGLCSAALWFSCLIPQIALNYKRRSVDGLSFLWASANFIAAFVNLNFALRLSLPLYVTAMAIYMPVLEAIILMQFACFHPQRWVRRTGGALIALAAAATVTVCFMWQTFEAYAAPSEWVAVVLWSTETVPQLWMNQLRGSTGGQAPMTLLITFLGKTSDFTSMFCLDLPIQYKVMTYFSTATAYLNIVQYCWFRKQRVPAIGIFCMVLGCSGLLCVKVGLWGLCAPPALLAAVTRLGTLCGVGARPCASSAPLLETGSDSNSSERDSSTAVN